MRYLIAILLATISCQLWAAEPVEGLQLSEAPIHRNDIDSIKRGAKFFASNCLSCHTLKYLTYDKLTQDAAKAAGAKTDHPPVPLFGITPPDLSLEADVRGVDWIYTYLHSFYVDSTRPSGANNLLVPNTAMTNVLGPYQGEQVLVEHPVSDMFSQYEWFDLVKLTKQGSLSSEDFDKTTADVVNFLAYASAPYHADQERIGYWVLGFLVILFVMMLMLKKEYWKDVKKRRDE